MRLIDRDRLLTERMKSKYYHLPNGDIAVPLIDIDNAPVVDAVPVVRCEECTYSKPFNGVVIQCTRGADSRLKTDYCSYGKRKERDNG